MTSDAMMPMGRSRCGFLRLLGRRRHGVEADVGEEHDGAAAMMPDQPYGVNGDQFSGFTKRDAGGDEEHDRDQLDR